MKRLAVLACLLALCLCVSLMGCGNDSPGPAGSDDTPVTADYTLRLLYCPNDTLNPYTLISEVNCELAQLIFDPLFKFGNDFNLIPCLARSARQDATMWHITLTDATFSDGSVFRAEDVLYSFDLAKKCPRYTNQLSHVTQVSAAGDGVDFLLDRHDPYFCNTLTFPIIKADSDHITDSDGVIADPIGTGRFTHEKDRLIRNPAYFGGLSQVATIELMNAPDTESVHHYVQVGATDFYYAPRVDETVARMSAQTVSVYRNELVYIGINDQDRYCSDVSLRYAISALINRKRLTETAYFGNATAATGPIHPLITELKAYQTTEITANTQIAVENLEKIGYNRKNSAGYLVNASGYELPLTLLVNQDASDKLRIAQLLVNQFKDAGLRLTLVKCNSEEYRARLKNGDFQLYLAEVSMDDNFDVSPLVTPGGSCAYGHREETATVRVVKQYAAGEAALSDVVSAIESELPYIPLVWRNGLLYYSEHFNPGLACCETDLFLSFDGFIMP